MDGPAEKSPGIIPDDDLRSILVAHWDINPKTIHRLMGYAFGTFRVTDDQNHYILKTFPAIPETESRIAFENEVLNRLSHSPGISCPTVIKTKQSSHYAKENNILIRVLSYLHGDLLAESQLSESILFSLGQMLARMDLVLKDIQGPFPEFDRTWDLQHTLMNKALLHAIREVDKRRLASYFLHQFELEVLPRQYELPRQLIHGDANDWNILVEEDQIAGIFDFGDICFSWRINELAIGLTYVLMHSKDLLRDAGHMISGYHQENPLTELEVDLLYWLVAARLCTSVCRSAQSKNDDPDNEYLVISEAGASTLLDHWIQINPLEASRFFRDAAGHSAPNPPDIKNVLSDRQQSMSRSLSLSYDHPIHMHRSALQYMYDGQGRTYLDAYNNIMLVGHSHPQVLKAGMQTYGRLNTNTRYLYDELNRYAEKLLSYFPKSLTRVFFVNSGSAAADLALRLAFQHTGQRQCVVLDQGYHGNTIAAMDISSYKFRKGEKKEHVLELELPDTFKNKDLATDDPAGYYATRAVEQIREHRGKIAAFIAEPIVGCAGQVPLPKGYLKQVYPVIREQGGVCISDEVQVGFGRLGSAFWGFEWQDVVPDVVILGKPMGNGHPIGAVVCTDEIVASFENGPEFFSSFGGNPVSCAIGHAVLTVIEDESLQSHALAVGTFFKEELLKIKQENRRVADVRGEGLFLGIAIHDEHGNPDGAAAGFLANSMKDKGILISTDGPFNNVIKIKPPLCFNRFNVLRFIDVFRESLSEWATE